MRPFSHSERQDQNKDYKSLSETISALRFPLAVLVVCIHAPIDAWNEIPMYDMMRYIIVENIARIAVPLFLIISGLLFFHTSSDFGANVYTAKIKKRLRTLLVPYCLWNLLVLAMYATFYRFSPQSVPESMGNLSDYTVIDWLRLFWDGNGGLPVNFPLWYIRNLMALVLCSPLLFIFIKRLRYASLALFTAGALYFDVGSTHILSSAVFFGIGAYISIHRTAAFDIIVNKTGIAAMLYAVLLVLNIVTDVPVIHRTVILAGICTMTGVLAHLGHRGLANRCSNLEKYSFCIFVAHFPFLIAAKFVAKQLTVSNAPTAVIAYFAIVAFGTLSSMLMYKILTTYCQPIARLLLGRIK